MKQNKSFLNKLIGKNKIELEPGDILYFKDNKTYWLYTGKDIDNTDEEHLKCGLWSSEYISKLSFDSSQMYKVNNDIVFHFKFKDNKSLDYIADNIKSGNAIYIMTLNAEELNALNAVYTLYDIKNK